MLSLHKAFLFHPISVTIMFFFRPSSVCIAHAKPPVFQNGMELTALVKNNLLKGTKTQTFFFHKKFSFLDVHVHSVTDSGLNNFGR